MPSNRQHTLEDQEILDRFSHEPTRHLAFNTLVAKYQRRIYQLVRKIVITHEDADDISQEVFIKIWHNLEGFRQGSALFTWIYRIAVNESLAHLRRKRRRFFLPIGDVEAELTHYIETSPYISGDEITIRLQKHLLQLPEKQRLVFNLKYFENMTYEQMAEVTGTSVGGSKGELPSCRKKARRISKQTRISV